MHLCVYFLYTHTHTHTHSPEDIHSIVTGKLALKFAGPQIEAMQCIAKASEHRSVAEFKKVSRCGL